MDMNNGSHTDAEKSQAGTNLVIVILVLVIIVAGVKLLMSSDSAMAPSSETVEATTTEEAAIPSTEGMDVESSEKMPVTSSPKMPQSETPSGTALMPSGKGEAVFSVLSKEAVVVREIYVHNPARASEGDASWIQVYDGYRAVPAGQATLVFTVSLSAMQYDEVKVRTLNVSTGIPDETVKQMPVTITANEKSLITIEL